MIRVRSFGGSLVLGALVAAAYVPWMLLLGPTLGGRTAFWIYAATAANVAGSAKRL